MVIDEGKVPSMDERHSEHTFLRVLSGGSLNMTTAISFV